MTLAGIGHIFNLVGQHFEVKHMNPSKTLSEQLFEEFLTKNGLPFDRIPEENSPRPDYIVTFGIDKIIFEVKELSEDENFSKEPFKVSSRKIGEHIRSAIRKSSKQIQYGANQGIPSVLLVYNNIDRHHLFGTEPHDFECAMYGEYTVTCCRLTKEISEGHHGKNSLLREDNKTHFSAIGHLHPNKGEWKITIYENIFAKFPLSYERVPSCFDIIRVIIDNTPLSFHFLLQH